MTERLMQSEASFASEGGMSTISTNSLVDALAKIPPPKVDVNIDCFIPKQMAQKLEAAGVKKGKEIDLISMFLLAIHAGMFVAFGAGFFTVVHSAGSVSHTQASYGVLKFAGGLAFCTGLAMVILCGSELFTGNNMMIMAWCTRKITTFQMFKNLFVVYIGNFVGSIIMACLQIWGRTYENGGSTNGMNALAFAEAKCGREWGQCYCLGILCNIMVCWAVWMTISAREARGKLFVFILPITAFAAMGFEHSVANMYFLPYALMIKTYAPQTFWDAIKKKRDDYTNVAIGQCIWWNYFPCTLGNMNGAMIFLGFIYWYLYLRDDEHESRLEFSIGGMKFLASPPPKPEPKKK